MANFIKATALVIYLHASVSFTMKTKSKMVYASGLTTKVLLMSGNSMKEAIAEIKRLNKAKAEAHRLKHQHEGLCQPFTDKEYKQIVTKMKTSYGAKAKKHSYNALWRHYDVKIETL